MPSWLDLWEQKQQLIWFKDLLPISLTVIVIVITPFIQKRLQIIKEPPESKMQNIFEAPAPHVGRSQEQGWEPVFRLHQYQYVAIIKSQISIWVHLDF